MRLKVRNYNKKDIVRLSLIAVALLTIAGISFAIWNCIFTGTACTIETAEISLSLLEVFGPSAIENGLCSDDSMILCSDSDSGFSVFATTNGDVSFNVGSSYSDVNHNSQSFSSFN